MMERLIDWMERGYVADVVLRAGIRKLLRKRLSNVDQGSCELNQERLENLIAEFSDGPIAVVPEKANEQHYEVPPELFWLMLGPRRKYSSCVWPEGAADLAAAEDAALQATCERADLEDGQAILELGCGWGSLTLWMAKQFPRRQNHGGVQFGLAAGVHSFPSKKRRHRKESDGDHCRHERFSAGWNFRSSRLGGDVRTHAKPSTTDATNFRLAQAGRKTICSHLLPSVLHLQIYR